MAFTDDEKTRILRFLGYPDWVSLAGSIQLGYPASGQPLYLVRDSFNRLTETGEQSVRKDLCECEKVEKAISSSTDRLKASKVGEITMNADEMDKLVKLLQFWVKRLSDDLGVFPNPFSQMATAGAGGGLNAKVQ